MNIRFEGILTPTVTPLDEKERVDELGFVKHLNRLIDNGIHGIYLLGTSGEFVSLTNAERQRAMEIAVNAVDGRVPIICGVMDSSTQRVVQNIELAQEFKIDAVAATPPYYYPATSDADIVEFYTTIAQSTDLPVIIYNIPVMVKTAIKPEVVRELAEEQENIVGIKDSTGDWTNFLKMLIYLGDHENFSILLGSYTMAGVAIMFGAEGAVISISNVDPKRSVQLYNAAKNRNIDEVDRLQKQFMGLSQLYTYGSAPSCLKACLEVLGVCRDCTTSPLLPIGETEKGELRKLLTEYGVI
ncbi:MAG: dihydrodipicolinate synthase family protein [Candidatus Poribacteria bacterium]|nr:dihydrodipicolinate synthase family protein [Candidatus Poribacteria bacterium]